MNYENVVVKKPWGKEYLCYRNEEVAIWFLHIEKDKQTSMHCHPNKNTGFILLNGKTELSFLRNTIKMKALDKIHIFRSRFHSTKATSKGGAYILEVETPEDKDDLVRLEDAYGRKGKKYEGEQHHSEKTDDCIWIPEASKKIKSIHANGCLIQHFYPQKKYMMDGNEEELFIISKGGVATKEGQRVVWPGDVIDGKTLSFLLNTFNFQKETTLISIKNDVLI